MAYASSQASNDINSSGSIGLTSTGIMGIAAVVGAIALIGFVLWYAFKGK
jgi:hypothetical protein